MMRRKKKKQIELYRLLAAVPAARVGVRSERRGEATLFFVPKKKRWFARVFSGGPSKQNERVYELDTISREVWEACDGERSIERIVEAFSQHHRLWFHEARLTVLRSVQMLAQRGLIVMTGLEE